MFKEVDGGAVWSYYGLLMMRVYHGVFFHRMASPQPQYQSALSLHKLYTLVLLPRPNTGTRKRNSHEECHLICINYLICKFFPG